MHKVRSQKTKKTAVSYFGMRRSDWTTVIDKGKVFEQTLYEDWNQTNINVCLEIIQMCFSGEGCESLRDTISHEICNDGGGVTWTNTWIFNETTFGKYTWYSCKLDNSVEKNVVLESESMNCTLETEVPP